MSSLFKFFAFVGAILWSLVTLASFLLLPSTGATLVTSAPPKPAIASRNDASSAELERARDEQAAAPAIPPAVIIPDALLAAKFTTHPDRFLSGRPIAPTQFQPAPQVAALAALPAKQPAIETVAILGVLTAEEIAAERGHKVAGRKAKVAKAKAKARQELTARERAAGNQYASGQIDQFYYGQRQPVAATSVFPSQQRHAVLAGFRTTVAVRASAEEKREVRMAKAKANARQRYASPRQSPFYGQGSSQAMPVSAYAPQRSYGPFGRGW